MEVVENLKKLVEKKPIILKKFDETDSERLNKSRNAFERLTFIRRHNEFDHISLPTLCIVETTESDGKHCYLGVFKRKQAAAQLDTRATIVKLREISIPSFECFCDHLIGTRNKNLLKGRIPVSDEISLLSPKISSEIVQIIADDTANELALNVANRQLLGVSRFPDVEWSQLNAIHLAMEAFGLEKTAIPIETTIQGFSTLDYLGNTLYEDNVIGKDASSIPGFFLIEKDITGRSVFVKGREQLEVYTANRLPLERMLGVDLIYLNEITGNIVMVQYKMLEEIESPSGEDIDWVFRLDDQTKKEISRMIIPGSASEPHDYRLNKSPFFFKFVKRTIGSEKTSSFYISLDHFNQLVSSHGSIGERGSIRLSYQALGGNYLRAEGMVHLIRSGYVGTHRVDYHSLRTIIAEVANGNKGLVLAWQRRTQFD